MAAKMFALSAILALCASTITATYVPGYFPPAMALGAMNPCMQYCAMQQPFTKGSFTSPSLMMLQQPFASPFQQYLTPMMAQRMMTQAQCNCGARLTDHAPTTAAIHLEPHGCGNVALFFQQPFVGVPF